MKRLLLIFLLAPAILTSITSAQPSITWQRLYNGPQSKDDEGNVICKAEGNNVYIAGSTPFTLSPNIRLYIIKINGYGDTLWTRAIPVNGTHEGKVYGMMSLPDGGCVITGEANLKFLIRLDINGNVVWQSYYAGNAQLYDVKRAH